MKRCKKLLAFILSAVMMMAMVTTAFAANITVGNDNGAQFVAYKLLDAKALGGGKFKYTLNEKYADILKAVTEEDTEDNIVKYINAMTDDSEEVRTFADSVYTMILEQEIEADGESVDGKFTNMDQGYYMIAEKTTADAQDPYTFAMLDTAGQDDITVDVKEDQPTLSKEIKHNESDSWGVVGDNQIGDTVYFRTITSVPKYTGNYDVYVYTIHDTMSAGLTSNVVTGNTNDDVVVKVNDSDVLDAKYVTVTANGNTFTVAIDVKAAIEAEDLATTDMLYTYYTGLLNKDALVYDEGKQDNVAYLEYSNNPYDDESTTNTPEDIVYDWTFKMGVSKVDGDGNKLDGAKFVLSRTGDLTVTMNDAGELSSTENLIALVKEEDGVYRVATSEDAAEDITYVVDAGDALIKGLDDAVDYYFYEVKAPEGYNLLEAPVQFQISADYVDDGSNYTTVTVTVDEETSNDLTTDIVNNEGIKLPSTGGIGTTIFYVVGGLLMAAAIVLLSVKKRMSAR